MEIPIPLLRSHLDTEDGVMHLVMLTDFTWTNNIKQSDHC